MNLSGCTTVVDDQVLGRISAIDQGGGQTPPTGAEALAENHMFAGGPYQNLVTWKSDMLSWAGSAGVDIAVLFRTVNQEAAGRSWTIGDKAGDLVNLLGGSMCDRGVPGACGRTGGLGIDDVSLGLTNITRDAFNYTTGHRCGGGGSGSWTDLIASGGYGIQMAAFHLAALDCDIMDHVRSHPNQFRVVTGSADAWGWDSSALYQRDSTGNRILSRNALSMFGYVAGLPAAMRVLNNGSLDTTERAQWMNRQNAAVNRSTMASPASSMNLSSVNDFYCSYDGFFSC